MAVTAREKTSPEPGFSSGLSLEAVEALSALRREPSWLRELRREAWSAFERLPMPTSTTEGWRRTDIRNLRLDDVVPAAEPLAPVSAARSLPAPIRSVVSGRGDSAGLLVQQDTSPRYRDLADGVARRGVILTDLATAVREHEALVREHLASVVSATEEKFAALHLAFSNSGAFVYVPRGTSLELPLHAVNYVGRSGLGIFPHTLLVADADAEVTLVDEYLSGGREGQGLASEVVELIAKAGARVRYVHLQEWGSEQWTFSTMRARVERNASVRWLVVGLGGSLTRATVDSRLFGANAETDIVGLVFGDQRQHFDHYTVQWHGASDTRSDLLFKAVLQGRSSANYVGLVRITEEARRCDANQESRNLLLSGRAKADADPRLEILNSDVIRASHGASVGPVDQEMLFYVMSRGLSQREAEELLVAAFFDPVLARVPLPSLRKKLWASIERRLGGNGAS